MREGDGRARLAARPLRWHDALTLPAAQAACLGLTLPLREAAFVLGPIVGAAAWGVVATRARPELLRAVKLGAWGGNAYARAPFHALVPAVAASAFVGLAYLVGVAWSAFEWHAGEGAPSFVKTPAWLVFGAAPLGAIVVGAHFVASVVGLRAAFLFAGRGSDGS